MTEILLAAVADYGLLVILAVTFASCLAVPVPASLVMLAGGGFVTSGDLSLFGAVSAAFSGAVIGDQIGYALGRRGAARLTAWTARKPRRQRIFEHARQFTAERGVVAVFLSRWLFSPLGPYVNLVGGMTRMEWMRFTIAAALGEAAWVGLYVGAGRAFSGSIEAAAAFLGNFIGALAAGTVTLVLGLWLAGEARRRVARR